VRNIELPDGSRLDVAIGIASSDRHPDPYEMISAADRDLYRPQTEKEVKK
jgi:PleD family two-component response regulator